jgi:hypothetical protein
MPIDRIPKETILAAIEKLGPCQPIDIRKELRLGDSFLIGALLSELVADRKLAITKVKRGGSPFYYDITKPETLDAVSKYLNEKDRRTYAMLKEQRVMREDTQEPLVRVGLQNMPDFSKRVEIDGVVYWRYFLVDEKEAKGVMAGVSPAKEETAAKDEAKKEERKEEKTAKEVPGPTAEKPKRTRKKKATEETSTLATSSVQQQTLSGEAKAEVKPAKRRSKKAPAPVIMPDGAVMISPQEWLEHDTLYARVQAFAGGTQLRDARVHKPHSELTCILAQETPFGKLDVFVHAFNRKFTVDDIKASLPTARELGLPVLILSVDPIPAKVASAFKGMPNLLLRTLT